MIELNCSYEESKKILELGYDFSKVCWKSLYEYRNQYKLNQTFIKIHLHGTHLSLASIEDEIKSQMSKYGIIDLVTPIIPKAALEACLPGGLLVDIRCLSTDFRKVFSTPYSKESIELFWDGHSFEPDTVIHKTNSIYEMFLWCHENHPEELKKKFDEVMA